ncbi:hypothetical protein C4565_00545 [Candidatus Parcubacteria bacterium]|nr:MAG: hypothetical protein C4565_00545 [Candidatus Parcubacteria bacterium]
MWVYLRTDNGKIWTVGFYDPEGKWQPDSDHTEREEAAKRVHWLNGGSLLPIGEWKEGKK